MSNKIGLSLFQSLMIGSDLENAVNELREGILKQRDPAHFASRVAEKYNVNVRDLITTYQQNLTERENLQEAPMDDAVADVEAEGEDALPEIAQEYGISPEALRNAYQQYKERKPVLQKGEEQARREKEKAQNRSEGAKKAYRTKVANMVDKVAREHGITANNAAEYVAEKLNTSVEKVDDIYNKVRGQFPPNRIPQTAPKLKLPNKLPSNEPQPSIGRFVYMTIKQIVNQLGISEEDAVYYWDKHSKIDEDEIYEYFRKYTGKEPSSQIDKIQGLTELQKENIAQLMQDAVAEQFPDGDPIDVIVPRIKKEYGQEVLNNMHQIFQEVNGMSFPDYLDSMQDEFANELGM